MSAVVVLDRSETLKAHLKEKFEAKGLRVIESFDLASECEIAQLACPPHQVGTACITACRIEGCEAIKQNNPVAVVINLSLFALDGLSVVRRLKRLWPGTSVIAMVEPEDSALINNVLEFIQQGAADFLVKPVSDSHVERVVDQARRGVLQSALSPKGQPQHNKYALVGHCDAMKALYARMLQIGRMEKVSGRVRSVLITGETGTGKQLVARALHTSGLRPLGPFVEINCAAIPAPLLEAELFGYEKGAFTDAKTAKPGLFEEADGGTLFLDEVCSMNISVQAKILKAIEDKSIRRIGGLQSRVVDVRIIAASNKTNSLEIEKSLRQDLYYRLSSFMLNIPPLRERGEDILVLARCFLERISKEWDGVPRKLTPDAEQVLMRHAWPGNVRELMHMMDRAAAQNMGETISGSDLELVLTPTSSAISISKCRDVMVDFGTDGIDLEEVERQIIVKALERAKWNRTEAARLLGISKDTLRYRIEKFQLSPVSATVGEPGVMSVQ